MTYPHPIIFIKLHSKKPKPLNPYWYKIKTADLTETSCIHFGPSSLPVFTPLLNKCLCLLDNLQGNVKLFSVKNQPDGMQLLNLGGNGIHKHLLMQFHL